MIRVDYVCPDGTPFPVEFESAEQAARKWTCEREHTSEPSPPLSVALGRLGFPGGVRACEEAGTVMPQWFEPGPAPYGFAYFDNGDPDPEVMAKLFSGCTALVAQFGSGVAVWRERCLPRVKAICEWLRSADTVSLAELAEAQGEGFQLTMIPAFIVGNDVDLLAKACQPVVGEDALLTAYELTQGLGSETLSANQEVWELGRLAAASPPVQDALGADDVAAAMAGLRESGEAPAFFSALDRFLAEHGLRTEAWDIAAPTWQEQGPGLWAMLRPMAAPDAAEPRLVVEEGARRREALVAKIESELAADAEALARFRRRLERARPYVAVREERAKWQLILLGSLRLAVLARGTRLVGRGAIDRADDVMFLLPDEVEAADAGDLRTVVAGRRREHERWRRVVPPTTIGGGLAPKDGASSDRLLRGEAASRGVATGPARVVLDLEGADVVEPGDVLVCVTTSPPWTPLFAIASAVVTDSGGPGSHTAIAAREFGIPAVLGTKVATQVIVDGARVRVDGTAGTVEVVAEG